jgi:integrase
MSDLRQHDDVGAPAFDLMVLTAARSSEVLKAKWNEFKSEERVWVIPAARMKAGKEHRVPLSDGQSRSSKSVLQRVCLRRTRHRACQHAYPGSGAEAVRA